MTRRPRVPGLSDEWAQHQLDLLEQVATNPARAYATATAEHLTPELLEAARDAVLAAPMQPAPPVCRHCTLVAETPGGPAFTCVAGTAGCLMDRALLEHGAVDGDGQPLAPCCSSCTAVPGKPGAWDCDPDRPGCPLHDVPERTR